MSNEALFVAQYPNVAIEKITMVWNGKRGFAFDDQNQGFRERVILEAIGDKPSVQEALLFDLMYEEAVWADKTLSFRYYLPELAQYLLSNAFRSFGLKIAVAFHENRHAMQCLVDFTESDAVVGKWIKEYHAMRSLEASEAESVKAMVESLEGLLDLREEKAHKDQVFEAYVKHKDPLLIAIKKGLKRFWQETELQYLALFFIIPLVLILGYYFFGLSILYGMLPMFRTLMILYIIYRVIAKIIG